MILNISGLLLIMTICLEIIYTLVSHAYGFGLMDAYAMVKLAEAWDSVPQQRKYVRPVIYDDHTPRRIPPNSSFLIPVEVNII